MNQSPNGSGKNERNAGIREWGASAAFAGLDCSETSWNSAHFLRMRGKNGNHEWNPTQPHKELQREPNLGVFRLCLPCPKSFSCLPQLSPKNTSEIPRRLFCPGMASCFLQGSVCSLKLRTCGCLLPENPHFPRNTPQAGIGSQIFTLPPCQVHFSAWNDVKFVTSFPFFLSWNASGREFGLLLLNPGLSLQIYLFLFIWVHCPRYSLPLTCWKLERCFQQGITSGTAWEF